MLIALYLGIQSKLKGGRHLTLNENELKKFAQPFCRSNLYDKSRFMGRNALQCLNTLIEKGLVRKEMVRDVERWGLLNIGEILGQCCAEYDRAVNQVIPVKNISERSSGMSNLTICLDSREDVHLLERIKMCCEDEFVPYSEKELPSGDYLFVNQDNVLPLIVERKSWSDLADSCVGKGRAVNRLDCVSLGNSECAGNCQICKMKRSGCTNIMFIIEGERCLGRDGTHRSVKKCTIESPCIACRQLIERHKLTQDVLEGVIDRLQIEHGCLIHYTKSYNETIQSLFDIRTLLLSNSTRLRGELQPYEIYASNSRRRSTNDDRMSQRPTSVKELEVEALLTVAGGDWNRNMVRNLLGLGMSEPPSRSQESTHGAHTHARSNAGGPICIDLDSTTKTGTKDKEPISIPNKRRKKTKNDNMICLDLDDDSDVEEVSAIRGGGDVLDLLSDDEIEVVTPKQATKRATKQSAPQSSRKRKAGNVTVADKEHQPFLILYGFDEYHTKVSGTH